jgi:hypothetical protein
VSSTAYHKAIVPKDATQEEIEAAVADTVKAMTGAKLLPGTKHRLFDGVYTGVGVMLPGWSYPIVISAEGKIAYDHYHGKWGNPQHLAAFEKAYSAKLAHNVTTRKVLATAAAEGMAVVHNEVQADGTRVIRVQVGSDRAQVSQMVGGGGDFVEGVRI